jgi:hypothetical protein
MLVKLDSVQFIDAEQGLALCRCGEPARREPDTGGLRR